MIWQRIFSLLPLSALLQCPSGWVCSSVCTVGKPREKTSLYMVSLFCPAQGGFWSCSLAFLLKGRMCPLLFSFVVACICDIVNANCSKEKSGLGCAIPSPVCSSCMVNKQIAKSYVTAECSWDFWQLHEIIIVLLMSQPCSSWDVYPW